MEETIGEEEGERESEGGGRGPQEKQMGERRGKTYIA